MSEHDFNDMDLFYVAETYPDFFRDETMEQVHRQLEAKNSSRESLNVSSSGEGIAKKLFQNRQVQNTKNNTFEMSGVLQAFDM